MRLNMIKNYFKDWTKFELTFLICGLAVSILSSVIFKGTIVDTLYTSLYLITSILMSKGKVECFFVGLVAIVFYRNSFIQSRILWRTYYNCIFDFPNIDYRNCKLDKKSR